MAALPQTISPTVAAIEAAVAARAERHDDLVVRGSAIGRPCERHLWYRFRWAHGAEAFEPRMLRLFETGHLEEARMVGWLCDAGLTVADVDPATGKQWEVIALGGHFAGHLDGIVTGVPDAPVIPHLLECKTHNAKSFAQLVKVGVEAAKPEHVAQMQAYMTGAGLTRALYVAKCKDDDSLHVERLHADITQAVRLMAKVGRVVGASRAPARISNDPANFACRFCHSAGICHNGDWPRTNCRTCLHASAVLDGDARWTCARHRIDLTLDMQRTGCPSHLYLPDLVPGEQVDADEAGEWVGYRLADGSTWRDGAGAAS